MAAVVQLSGGRSEVMALVPWAIPCSVLAMVFALSAETSVVQQAMFSATILFYLVGVFHALLLVIVPP